MTVAELAKECWIEGAFEKVYSLCIKNGDVVTMYEHVPNWINGLSMSLANQEVACINIEKRELVTINRVDDDIDHFAITNLLSKYGLIDLDDDAEPVKVPTIKIIKE